MEETQQPKNENDNENEKLAMFNKKYNTELTLEENIIDLSKKNLGNEGLELLSKLPLISINNVIELNLSVNGISDISPLIFLKIYFVN